MVMVKIIVQRLAEKILDNNLVSEGRKKAMVCSLPGNGADGDPRRWRGIHHRTCQRF